jgi:hypothetical protein
MTMPSGSSPDDAQAYYDYLLAHHQNDGRIATWTVTGSRWPGCGDS